MRYFRSDTGATQVGLAYGPGIPEFIAADGGVDYVELPFEQLRHAPEVASIQETLPVVLHCASLSVAGFVPPAEAVLASIAREAERTRTPWIGEHLAFLSAESLDEGGPTTELTYTVCPQLSEETARRAAANLAALQRRFAVPLIVENSPQYFAIPGSTLSMAAFIAAVLARSEAGLLLDLTHFLIAMLNTGGDAAAEIERLPLERVVEIHVSGLSVQSGTAWDDHATPAPKPVFDLLERVLRRARPRAVTLEYNWSRHFPRGELSRQIDRVRALLARA